MIMVSNMIIVVFKMVIVFKRIIIFKMIVECCLKRGVAIAFGMCTSC